jgi:Fe-S-cluster containining protein
VNRPKTPPPETPPDGREPIPVSPVQPVALSLEERFRFRCHKGIPCFNKCCENTDILLTPYDILRLKNRLDLSSREFLDRYTRDCELDAHGTPGVKLGHKQGSSACVFLTPEGCSVYEDRPAACRYYALGLMSMRRKGSSTDEDSYFVVKEDHCLGHLEPQEQTVGEYRREQGVDRYDEANREWRRIILKKRSAGPTVGRPSQRSFELFFLASYDIDGFRAFVASEGFREVFDLPDEEYARLLTDEEALLQFAFRFLRQVLYGERTIQLKKQAVEERGQRYREKLAERAAQSPEERSRQQDEFYKSLLDE